MSEIVLVAVDLDGTLLTSDKSLAPRGSQLLTQIAKQGVRVVICTTRNPDVTISIAKRLKITDPLICSNGAQIWASPDGPVWAQYTIPMEVAQTIAEMADIENWELITTIGSKSYARQRRDQPLGVLSYKWTILPTNVAAITDNPTRMLAHQPEAIVQLRDLCQTQFANQCRTETYYEPDGSLNSLGIFPVQADKGTALNFVLDRLGLSLSQALAIGDNPNDIPMLQLAGTSVAMGNAPDAVKQQATIVAPSNDEEGVAWALQKYILKTT